MKTMISVIFLILSTSIFAQKLKVYKVSNKGDQPYLQWYVVGENLEVAKINIWRSTIDDLEFDTIHTLHYFSKNKQDTLIYGVIDTTLSEKGIYRYYISLETEEDINEYSPIVFGHNMGHIPKPQITNMTAVSSKERKSIEVNWQLNHHFSIRSLSLFRSSHFDKGFEKIADLAHDATSYEDIVPLSNHNYFYFILIADFFGYQKPSVPVTGYCSFDKKPFPPLNITLQNQKDHIRLQWHNIESHLSGYQVYRSLNKASFRPIHIMQTSNEKQVVFRDSITKQLTSNTTIQYYVVNYSDSYTKSNTSDTLAILITKTTKPMPPSQVNLITMKDNCIKLIWEANQNTELLGYNIYKTKPKLIKLNEELISPDINYYIDSTIKKSGLHTYSIESVGYNNMVSQFKTSASINLLSPYFNLIVDLHKLEDRLSLQWKALSTNRIKKIILYRQENENTPTLLKEYKNLDNQYTDHQVTDGNSYFYFFYGELNNGEKVLLSKPLSLKQ